MLEENRLIGALVKTTLVDFPERVAAALFIHGCNLRCPYCQNRDLVCGTYGDYDAVTVKTVLAHLQKRKDVLSGFVISGGEPLLFSSLAELITAGHELGYAVKLDTNGMFPLKLQELLQNPLTKPDFIALDIKTTPERYYELAGSKTTLQTKQKVSALIQKSIQIVSELPQNKREFRTVLVPNLIDEKEIKIIAKLLPKDASWKFAQFVNKNCLDSSYNSVMPYTKEKTAQLIECAQKLIPHAELR